MIRRSPLPGVTHLAIGVADLGTSKRFYAEVLGLDVRDLRGNAYVEWPGFLLVLDAAAPVASDPFHFGFRVEDDDAVSAWAETLRGRGATILSGPTPRPTLRTPGSVVAVADPDGHMIEIYSGD